MTDFNSEFNSIFKGSCSIKNYDWNKPRFFDKDNPCYDAEKALMASLTSEAYGKYGFEVDYFIKHISTKRDILLGEDPLENIERRFHLKVYTEQVPNLQNQYQLQGMSYPEIITVQAAIDHFKEASKLDYETFEEVYKEYYPKIGDLMYFAWCDTYYEVLNVKEFAEGTSFLSEPMTFTFSLRVWKNSHESVDLLNHNDDDMEHLRSYVELGETFDQDGFKPYSTVAASGDNLSINDDLKKDFDKKGKAKDNVASHALYEKEEGTIRIDPFDGW